MNIFRLSLAALSLAVLSGASAQTVKVMTDEEQLEHLQRVKQGCDTARHIPGGFSAEDDKQCKLHADRLAALQKKLKK